MLRFDSFMGALTRRDRSSMGERPQIRLATLDDAEFLVELSQRLFQRYLPNAGANMIRMMRNPSCTVLIAEHELRLGFAVVHLRSLGRDFGPWKRPSVAHLDAIGVRPGLAGRGLGRHLLAHAEAVARAHGAISMSLLTAERNVRARRLFVRAGYVVVAPLGTVYDGGQEGLAMQKSLGHGG
jgi:ribosomal protein S18 acetylase RimI-like enzyme